MISLNYRDARPIYEQVIDSIEKLISKGVLRQGDRLPSVRELAIELAVNPNTVQRAYKELEASGYIISVAGKGSYVSTLDAALAKKSELVSGFKAAVTELRSLGVSDEELIELIKGE